MFVIPLAFTLSGFLMWILHSLNSLSDNFSLWMPSHVSVLGTMAQLIVRKQRYKLRMFKRLYYILLATVVVIAIFFVMSSVSFSNRLAEGAPVIHESVFILANVL